MLADVFIYKSFTCREYSEFDADENLLFIYIFLLFPFCRHAHVLKFKGAV